MTVEGSMITVWCEHCDGGETCRNRARFMVGIGDRKTDRQASCGVHLARTVRAMVFSEGWPDIKATATVTLL